MNAALSLKESIFWQDFLLAISQYLPAMRQGFPDRTLYTASYRYQNGSRLRLTETGMALSDCSSSCVRFA